MSDETVPLVISSRVFVDSIHHDEACGSDLPAATAIRSASARSIAPTPLPCCGWSTARRASSAIPTGYAGMPRTGFAGASAPQSTWRLRVIGVRNGSQIELRDRIEVCWIAAVQRQTVSDGAGSDQRVVSARRRLSPGRAQ